MIQKSLIVLLDSTGLNRMNADQNGMGLCFELQLMAPGINIIIFDLYLAYFGNNILDGLLQKNGEDPVIAMNHLI